MTNGDKVRQMSDEEILELFFGNDAYLISMVVPVAQVINGVQIVQETTVRLIDWMREECSEG